MKPFRVLHVLGAMDRGGVETWLMHVLRHMDRERFDTDILVHTDKPAAYDSEALALGSRILRCPHTGNPLLYAWQFLQIIRQDGPFDVLHSHVHHFSGFVLVLGRIAGIPVRVAHSHSNNTAAELKASLARKIYLATMKRLVLANCTCGLAVSEPAATALFGPEWRQDRRLRVLYCGIDLAPFRVSFDPVAVRAEFGFSADDVIFGHVGRFSPVKNHTFFLEVATRILQRERRAKFLLVGDGPCRVQVERQAEMMGLEGKIAFAGIRPDVPTLMLAAMDVFVMPSAYEGLPLALMETQAAGLPCVASDIITEEAIVNPALVRRLALSVGFGEWARVACELVEQPRFDRQSAIAMLEESRFDIVRGMQQMCRIYRDLS